MGRDFRFDTDRLPVKGEGKEGAWGGKGLQSSSKAVFGQADRCPEVKVAHWRSPASCRSRPELVSRPACGVSVCEAWPLANTAVGAELTHPSTGNTSFHPATAREEETLLIPYVSAEQRELERHFQLHTTIPTPSCPGQEARADREVGSRNGVCWTQCHLALLSDTLPACLEIPVYSPC